MKVSGEGLRPQYYWGLLKKKTNKNKKPIPFLLSVLLVTSSAQRQEQVFRVSPEHCFERKCIKAATFFSVSKILTWAFNSQYFKCKMIIYILSVLGEGKYLCNYKTRNLLIVKMDIVQDYSYLDRLFQAFVFSSVKRNQTYIGNVLQPAHTTGQMTFQHEA